MLLHYLVKVETPKKRMNTNSAFNANWITAVKCIKLYWQFVYSDESYKWTLISEHVFKVSATSTHTWTQTVAPLLNHNVDNVLFKVKPSLQFCIKRFCRSSMARIFVSYTLCCITLQTKMWANAQPDGRPAEHRWRPLFNAGKFGWRPLLDAVQ